MFHVKRRLRTNPPHYHVVHVGDAWIVKKEGRTRPLAVKRAKAWAVDAARMEARRTGGHLWIHTKAGWPSDHRYYPMPT